MNNWNWFLNSNSLKTRMEWFEYLERSSSTIWEAKSLPLQKADMSAVIPLEPIPQTAKLSLRRPWLRSLSPSARPMQPLSLSFGVKERSSSVSWLVTFFFIEAPRRIIPLSGESIPLRTSFWRDTLWSIVSIWRRRKNKSVLRTIRRERFLTSNASGDISSWNVSKDEGSEVSVVSESSSNGSEVYCICLSLNSRTIVHNEFCWTWKRKWVKWWL